MEIPTNLGGNCAANPRMPPPMRPDEPRLAIAANERVAMKKAVSSGRQGKCERMRHTMVGVEEGEHDSRHETQRDQHVTGEDSHVVRDPERVRECRTHATTHDMTSALTAS